MGYPKVRIVWSSPEIQCWIEQQYDDLVAVDTPMGPAKKRGGGDDGLPGMTLYYLKDRSLADKPTKMEQQEIIDDPVGFEEL
jgi:hypothetical protein